MLQHWMIYLPMQNLSGFSVTFSLALTLTLQDVQNLSSVSMIFRLRPLHRLLRDRANPRRHAWTGKTVGTVLRERRHAMPTNVHGVGTSRRCASGGQTANCAAFTS
jgi:hypothetical protein